MFLEGRQVSRKNSGARHVETETMVNQFAEGMEIRSIKFYILAFKRKDHPSIAQFGAPPSAGGGLGNPRFPGLPSAAVLVKLRFGGGARARGAHNVPGF
jgi:hypothetical protein